MKSPFPVLAAPILTFLFSTTVIAGENITFPGNGVLATDPLGNANSLFPGTSLLNNLVTVTNGVIDGAVYGGVTVGSDIVADNSVIISGGTVSGASAPFGIAGGYSGGGNVTGNDVTITNGDVTGDVFGGACDGCLTTGNSVNLVYGDINGNLYGGYTNGVGSGNANGNSVVMLDGSVDGTIFGGMALGASGGVANGNSIWLGGGVVTGSLSGGHREGSTGNVIDNSVLITGGEVGVDVYGALNIHGDDINNNVIMTGGLVRGSVYAARNGYLGGTIDNSVTIMGGEVEQNVYGSHNWNGDSTGDSVFFLDGLVRGNVYGGHTDEGNVTESGVAMTGGVVSGNVYGGHNDGGDVTGSDVVLGGAATVTGDVFGGYNSGIVSSGAITDNSVIMIDGSVGGGVYGAMNYDGDVTGNSVLLLGGSVSGDVYGGFAWNGAATHNVVTIGAGAMLASSANLFGGYSDTGGDAFTGNILNLLGYQGMATQLGGFEYYNFALPANIANGQSMLTVLGGADLTNGAGRDSVIGMTAMGGGSTLQVGDRIILIDSSAGGLTSNTDLHSTALVQKGLFLTYDFDIIKQNDLLVATLVEAKINPQSKAPSEGRAAGAAFVNQGADLIAGQGLEMVAATARASDALPGCWIPFGAISGDSSRYDTGSHVDVNGFSLMTGLAWHAPLASNQLILAPFFEAGWGNYDSYNSFSNAPSVKGGGDTNYYGGGVMARYDVTEGKLVGLYGEGSLRAGRTSADFSSNDLKDSFTGQRASYDSSSTYYGAHAGLGYIFPLAEKTSMDISTKYLWTHQNSDSVTVANDPIAFKSTDSHRWRNGARINYEMTEQIVPYVGASYEYEFDGKAEAAAYGYAIDAPTLKGGSGSAELGLRYNPAADSALSADLAFKAMSA